MTLRRNCSNSNDHILLTTTSGYEGRLSEATVEIATSHVVSEQPVEVKLINGLLNANRLEILESGDVIRFEGGVELLLNQQQPASSDVTSSIPSKVVAASPSAPSSRRLPAP